jgi:hypothetical protein
VEPLTVGNERNSPNAITEYHAKTFLFGDELRVERNLEPVSAVDEFVCLFQGDTAAGPGAVRGGDTELPAGHSVQADTCL